MQVVGPTNRMRVGLNLQLSGPCSLSSSLHFALWNALFSHCWWALYLQILLFFLLCFSIQLNNKRNLAFLEFRNTDTAISCNISSNSYSDMRSSRGPVYTINVIVSESGYITVFFTNPVKNVVSICREDRILTVFPSQTGYGTHLLSSLPCKMEWCLWVLQVCLRVYPSILAWRYHRYRSWNNKTAYRHSIY